MKISKCTLLYSSPYEDRELLYWIAESTEITIMDDPVEPGWLHVVTATGKEGYMKVSDQQRG